MEADTFNDTAERFQAWFDGLPGATFNPSIMIADLRHRGCGRGIIACENIEPDTVLFTVPRASILNVMTSGLVKAVPSIFDPPLKGDEMDTDANEEDDDDYDDDGSHDSWSQLILALVYEFLRGPASAWKPYLDILPTSFDTPLFWTAEEIAELQASPLVQRIGKTDADALLARKVIPVIRQHQDVFFGEGPVLEDDELMALAHRMGSTIMSYAFDLEKDDDDEADEQEGWVEDKEGRGMLGMVPMADVLNANAQFNAHISHEEECLTIRSVRPIRVGDEVLNYYGPRPNSELLRQYGYVTQDHSRYDVVEIPWALVESKLQETLQLSDSEWARVMAYVDPDGLEDGFVLERDSPDVDSSGAFSGPASLKEMPVELVEQIKAVLKAARKTDEKLVPDKKRRDELLRRALSKSMHAMVARYATSIEDDVHALAKGRMSARHRMAIFVRLGEKQLLQEAIKLVEETEDRRPAKRLKR